MKAFALDSGFEYISGNKFSCCKDSGSFDDDYLEHIEALENDPSIPYKYAFSIILL